MELDAVLDAGRPSVGRCECDRGLVIVEADEPRTGECLRQLDQRASATTADIGRQRTALQFRLNVGNGRNPFLGEQVLEPAPAEALEAIPEVLGIGGLGDPAALPNALVSWSNGVANAGTI